MTTATVAWFTVNTFAGVDKLDLNISLAAQLKVSMENHGKDLEKTGVAPDINVRNTFVDRVEGKDPQLDRAIEEVMKQLGN